MAGAIPLSYERNINLASANNNSPFSEKSDCIAAPSEAIKSPRIHPNTMADREDKNSENITGKFYVDSQCIDCDLCRETAPNNFARAEDEGYSYVFKQPENDEETAQCREAMEGCPVEAIGDDGDE
jgi:ferredoxin